MELCRGGRVRRRTLRAPGRRRRRDHLRQLRALCACFRRRTQPLFADWRLAWLGPKRSAWKLARRANMDSSNRVAMELARIRKQQRKLGVILWVGPFVVLAMLFVSESLASIALLVWGVLLVYVSDLQD